MDQNDIEARLIVLESMTAAGVIAAFGMLKATLGTKAAINYLDEVRSDALNGIKKLNPDAQAKGRAFVDDLLSRISEGTGQLG